VLTTFHGFDVNAVTPELRASYEYLFAEGAAFTANTNYTAQRAIAFGCPSARLHLWPQGTRVREFPFAERTPPIGRPARVLSVGRLVPKKGFDTLLTAFARVRARGYDAELHIVGGGGGPHAERLRRLPAELGIADRVQFHGAQPPARVRDFMAAADVFVLASKTAPNGDKEGQALALQEAQACGLPVLSTLHNGIPEGVADGASGVLVPENDADALAGALIELLSQPQRWAAMGRAGRRFVEEHYELDRVTDQLMAIYAGLSGGPPDGRA
jgi:colanic acid/amylovoran biosynthesis glycosyltransferase